ncbi:histidinol-phosphate transaminase [Arthrobacter sp. 35W]|uniref:histidinol-phosphate transaminase n=1 Tax=Arthrobacter sp. 35W TaxID=1132441 RepID=UPI000402F40C|nr:histidinol-phosphate transaminase [Arthrobacter sp. 35W]
MPVATRTGLDGIPAYRQGRSPEAANGLEPYKLSSNENPYPPLPSVVDAVAAAVGSMHLYPDMSAAALAAAVAGHWNVAVENLAFGAGSVEVAAQLIHAVASPGDEVMFAWRSFEAYPVLTTVAGAVPVPVPLDVSGGHDLDAMLAAVTDKTRVIFVCNPNNPNGAVLAAGAVEAFVAAVPTDVLVVIDEAYLHFNVDPGTAVGVDLFRRHPHVAVLHTFSKAYGLAGLRLGYAIAQPELVENLRKAAVPFGVTALAQQAGIASLAAESQLQERIDVLVAERERVYAGLLDAGMPVLPSQANFLWVDSREGTTALASLFEEAGISVRAFAGEGMRISVGTPAANDRVLAVARAAAGAVSGGVA